MFGIFSWRLMLFASQWQFEIILRWYGMHLTLSQLQFHFSFWDLAFVFSACLTGRGRQLEEQTMGSWLPKSTPPTVKTFQ
jgi:hypothetical protein